MKSNFHRWNNMPLSLARRVQCVKMAIPPIFLYTFQCLPTFSPKKFFRTIDQLVSGFLLGNKVSRISKNILQRKGTEGGLALPNFLYYYWGANIHKVSYWLHAPETNWCALEAHSCLSSSLPALVFSSCYSSNPIVGSTLKIWIQLRRHFNFSLPSTQAPITNNHLFTNLDSAFTKWSNVGLKCFKDLYEDNIFHSFSSLSTKFGLSCNDFFRNL